MYEILLPSCFVIAGGLACLGSEAFIRNERKHAILPWIGTVFLLLSLSVQCWVHADLESGLKSIGELYALDPVRSFLIAAVSISALAALAGLQHTLRRDAYPAGEPYALTLLAASGVQFMIMANNYMGLFVGLELASIAIYATVGMRRHRLESGEAILKYLVMGAVFSAVFLYGIALTYGATGSFTYGAAVIDGREKIFLLGQTLIFAGLLFKVGAVPFHFWSPDAYGGAPIAVTGFMAGVVKVGGFVALGAIWMHLLAGQTGLSLGDTVIVEETLAATENPAPRLYFVLAGIAVLSLLVGNFSALRQTQLRRLMAFSSVSHAGYMLLAFSYAPTFSLQGLWYYLIAYTIASSALLSLLAGLCGEDDEDELGLLSGAARRSPILGFMATILIASLAGLPPTAGFLGKYLIFSSLLAQGSSGLFIAIVGMLLAVVGAVYYLRLIIDLWGRQWRMGG